MGIRLSLQAGFLLLSLFGGSIGCFRTFRYDPEIPLRINTKDLRFVDEYGRTRIFHGFNSVQKEPPWLKPDLLNDTKLDLYQQWGFNVVRLGMMWAGAEPTEGRFNHTYLGLIKGIVTRLHQRGMYVILDMHQDVLSSAFHAYDGVPRWLVDKIPPSPHPYPWPLQRVSFWSDGYLTQAVGWAFQAIYLNISNTADYMARFWRMVAAKFKDHSNVLGYELINEPWAGDIYDDPSLLLPRNAARTNLLPLYNRLNEAIREEDANTIVFYEPVTWGVFLNGEYIGSGFTSVPGGDLFKDRSALSYHYYCWLSTPGSRHRQYPSLTRAFCDKVLGPRVIPNVLHSVNSTGGALFLTEFGACEPDGNRTSEGTIECEFVMSEADRYFQSWTYWDSQFFDQHGNIRKDVVAPFARVYVRAVAGNISSMTYDTETKQFRLEYRLDPNIRAPTEIFVPPVHYPGGFSVEVPEGIKYTFLPEQNLLLVEAGQRQSSPVDIRVIILPKLQ